MRYEVLRKKYQECHKTIARIADLKDKANSGKLSPERLTACRQEIMRLTAEVADHERLFANLLNTNDPAWRKLSRELDTALNEYQAPVVNSMSLRRMAKSFIGTISLLILGTWIIDGLRKK
jgi:hypothetical protein